MQPQIRGGLPGPITGVLDAKLDSMGLAIQNLQQTANSKSSSTQQPFQLPWVGAASANSSLGLAPGNQSQGDIESKIKVMQFQLDKFEEQLGGDQINLAALSFRSHQEFK